MSGSNDGSGSWSSRFMKVAGAAAATAAVAGGLYAVLSSSTSASSEMEMPFGSARRESKESDDEDDSVRFESKESDDEDDSVRFESKESDDEDDSMSWKKPEIGWVWVKLNVDGSRDHYHPNGPSAGCGGVLRDASGKWLMGFAKKVDPAYKAHQVELQAILTGLEVASKMNIEKLVVESDSEPAVNMVKSGLVFKPHHPDYSVVQSINRLLENPKWQARLDYVPGTANRVADRLANDARKLFYNELREYPSAPENCTQLLLEDNNGQDM